MVVWKTAQPNMASAMAAPLMTGWGVSPFSYEATKVMSRRSS